MSARSPARVVLAALLAATLALAACRSAPVAREAAASGEGARWWKGNTHTHTLWSDGDDFPENVADWYRSNGYHFLSLTEHNHLSDAERWWTVPDSGAGREAYDSYRARFGALVEERRAGDTLRVRLRRVSEYAADLNRPGSFLVVPGEEITQYRDDRGAHMNALNLAEAVPPQEGASLVEMFRRDLERVREQEQRTGRRIVAVLNHPNFIWSQTAEDLLAIPGLRFFEVYNGHPLVNIRGDSLRAGNERIWDIVLSHRLATGGELLYGVATDDAHHYHRASPRLANTGRGWVVVRAPALEAGALMEAMRRGDFYASSGVELDDIRFDGRRLSLAIRGAPGVTYTTQFVGTRRGFDTTSVAVTDSTGRALTRRYSPQLGAVLHEATGTSPSYTLRGDELYVRARVTSSKAKSNPTWAGEVEMAWGQPVRP